MGKQTYKTTIRGKDIEYGVKYSTEASEPRIDVGIYGIEVIIPDDNDDFNPANFLSQHSEWVVKKDSKYQAYRDKIPTRNFQPGEQFPLFGKPRQIVPREVDENTYNEEKIILSEKLTRDFGIRHVLREFYRNLGDQYLSARADHYSEESGIEFSSIQLRNQRTRWGSFSPKTGTLSLNWRLLMAPKPVIDYIIVHELAHGRYPNRGAKFWRLVADYCPAYQKHATWLESNSVKLIFSEDDI